VNRVPAARRMVAATLARIGLARIADRMGLVVYVGATLQAHGASWAAVVGAAALLPAALGALVGGHVVAVVGGPRLALASGLTKAAAAALLAWLLVVGDTDPLVIAGTLGLVAFLDMPARVAFEATRPPVARLARIPLLRLNGWDEALEQGVGLAGPAAGALALLTLGPGPAAILVAGLTCLTTLTLIAMLPALRGPVAPPAMDGTAFRTAAARLWRDRAVRNSLLLMSLGLGVFIGVEVLLLPALLVAGQDQGGHFLTALGTGAVIGSAGAVLWRRALEQRPVGQLLAAASLSAALGLLAVVLAPATAAAVAVGGGLAGLAAAPITPLVMTLLQSRASRMQRPYTISIALAAMLGGAPLAILLIGVASWHIAPRDLTLVAAFVFVVLGALAAAGGSLSVSLAALRTRSVTPQTW
jgi:hypothetical protein